MLDRPLHASNPGRVAAALDKGIPDRQRLLRFLAGRPFVYQEHEEEEEDKSESGDHENYVEV